MKGWMTAGQPLTLTMFGKTTSGKPDHAARPSTFSRWTLSGKIGTVGRTRPPYRAYCLVASGRGRAGSPQKMEIPTYFP